MGGLPGIYRYVAAADEPSSSPASSSRPTTTWPAWPSRSVAPSPTTRAQAAGRRHRAASAGGRPTALRACPDLRRPCARLRRLDDIIDLGRSQGLLVSASGLRWKLATSTPAGPWPSWALAVVDLDEVATGLGGHAGLRHGQLRSCSASTDRRHRRPRRLLPRPPAGPGQPTRLALARCHAAGPVAASNQHERRASAGAAPVPVDGRGHHLQGVRARSRPGSFFDTLATFDPYNAHFIRDIGAIPTSACSAPPVSSAAPDGRHRGGRRPGRPGRLPCIPTSSLRHRREQRRPPTSDVPALSAVGLPPHRRRCFLPAWQARDRGPRGG